MRLAALQHSSYLNRTSLRSRAIALVFSLAVSVLIVLMLLRLGALPPVGRSTETKPIVVQLLPEAGPKAEHAHERETARKKPATPRVPPPLPPPPVHALNMLVLSSEEFAATDISRLSSHSQSAANDANAANAGGAAEGPGQGPGGEKLYNAEWYREPSHAELAGYLPRGVTEAEWGMIACRTIEKFHVDDCQELSESPPGSGLARALRLAAWQFLVRPPRIGGRPMVGAWVRIRFDFTRDAAK